MAWMAHDLMAPAHRYGDRVEVLQVRFQRIVLVIAHQVFQDQRGGRWRQQIVIRVRIFMPRQRPVVGQQGQRIGDEHRGLCNHLDHRLRLIVVQREGRAHRGGERLVAHGDGVSVVSVMSVVLVVPGWGALVRAVWRFVVVLAIALAAGATIAVLVLVLVLVRAWGRGRCRLRLRRWSWRRRWRRAWLWLWLWLWLWRGYRCGLRFRLR
jgi:hypothetical protein